MADPQLPPALDPRSGEPEPEWIGQLRMTAHALGACVDDSDEFSEWVRPAFMRDDAAPLVRRAVDEITRLSAALSSAERAREEALDNHAHDRALWDHSLFRGAWDALENTQGKLAESERAREAAEQRVAELTAEQEKDAKAALAWRWLRANSYFGNASVELTPGVESRVSFDRVYERANRQPAASVPSSPAPAPSEPVPVVEEDR